MQSATASPAPVTRVRRAAVDRAPAMRASWRSAVSFAGRADGRRVLRFRVCAREGAGDDDAGFEKRLGEAVEHSRRLNEMQDDLVHMVAKRRALVEEFYQEHGIQRDINNSSPEKGDEASKDDLKLVPFKQTAQLDGREDLVRSQENSEDLDVAPISVVGATFSSVASEVQNEDVEEDVITEVENTARDNENSVPLAGANVMNVIIVAIECAPWSKTGGLGDVAGSLPKALARRGHRVMVVAPRYGDYYEPENVGVRKYYKVDGQDMEVNYYQAYIDGVDFVFIDAPPFRHLEHDIYGGSRRDVLKRMILFCKAAVEVPWHVPCGGICYGDNNLVFVANDWHAALLPVYLKAYYRENGRMQYARSVLVIHNIAHQGRCPVDDFSILDLPYHYLDHFKLYDPIGGEHANVLAGGIKNADRLVTVSKGYLWELKSPEGGWGLHEIINHNHWKMEGIVNGIDTREWNPEYDAHLNSDGYCNFNLGTLQTGKRQCKAALQRELGLEVAEDLPLLGFIGRLDGQKGVELIGEAIPWIVGQEVQIVMLGTGRPDLEQMLKSLEAQYNDRVRGWVGFSARLAHRITAGADVLLMPSRFEPCGLNQLYAMMYGTIPVVHSVGGLRDTVTPFDPFNDSGLGWAFDRAEANKLIEALGHCLNTYRNYKDSWRGLQVRGMSQDLSWNHAAQQYEEALLKAKHQW